MGPQETLRKPSLLQGPLRAPFLMGIPYCCVTCPCPLSPAYQGGFIPGPGPVQWLQWQPAGSSASWPSGRRQNEPVLGVGLPATQDHHQNREFGGSWGPGVDSCVGTRPSGLRVIVGISLFFCCLMVYLVTFIFEESAKCTECAAPSEVSTLGGWAQTRGSSTAFWLKVWNWVFFLHLPEIHR